MESIKQKLEKQGHRFSGEHCAVKICRWTRKSLIDNGECYKSKFYGIDSYRCCQMSPWLECQNKCLHCWRPIEFDFKIKGKINSPQQIIKDCIEQQQNLLSGFKGNSKINLEKFKQAQEPMQFAISLTGEPTLYPKIGKLISELRKQGKTSFLVTNGLCPDVLKEMSEKNCLPTQLYISLNYPNKELFRKITKNKQKDSWEKFNQSLDLMKDLKTRRVLRMTLIRDLNMKDKYVEEYVKLIKKALPDFVEIKGYMSVGFARQRLGYDKMPSHEEIKDFANKIVKKLGEGYKILDKHEFSRVVLVGRNKGIMKIREGEV